MIEEEIDEIALRGLTESMIADLIPKIGQRSKFCQYFNKLLIFTLKISCKAISNENYIKSF